VLIFNFLRQKPITDTLKRQFMALGLNRSDLAPSDLAESSSMAAEPSSVLTPTPGPSDMKFLVLPTLSIQGAQFMKLQNSFHLCKAENSMRHCSEADLSYVLQQYSIIHTEVAAIRLESYWDSAKQLLLGQIGEEIKKTNGRLMVHLAHGHSLVYDTGELDSSF
jgi:hypothetical protein